MLFHVVEVMRSLSSIIKGQRVRHESTLEIENTSAQVAPEQEDKELATKDHQEDIAIQIQEQQSRAKIKADNIIKAAKEEAEKIIADGQKMIGKELPIALEQAREEGYSKGYTDGHGKGQLDAQALIEEGKEIVASAITQKKQLLDTAEPETIEMIIAICRKLISEEVEFNPQTILVLIRKALRDSPYDTTEISIKVSPNQYEFVLENKDIIMKDYVNASDIQILKDPQLANETCIIETPFGSVECSIDKQFAEMEKQMRLICDKK